MLWSLLSHPVFAFLSQIQRDQSKRPIHRRNCQNKRLFELKFPCETIFRFTLLVCITCNFQFPRFIHFAATLRYEGLISGAEIGCEIKIFWMEVTKVSLKKTLCVINKETHVFYQFFHLNKMCDESRANSRFDLMGMDYWWKEGI